MNEQKLTTELIKKRLLLGWPEWEGDLNDDCTMEWKGLSAHVEQMSKNHWYFSVWITGTKQDIFHSTDDDVVALSGNSARNICEIIMKSYSFPPLVDRIRDLEYVMDTYNSAKGDLDTAQDMLLHKKINPWKDDQ